MPEEKNKNINESCVKSKAASIGALLINARTHASLSQADLADQMNLPIHTIKDLENDNFENLPEATYVRGYLRSYARIVGISPDGLISAFNEQHQTEKIAPAIISSKQSYDTSILWSTAAVVTILVGLLATWWLGDTKNTLEGLEVVQSSTTVSQPVNNQESPETYADPFSELSEINNSSNKESLQNVNSEQTQQDSNVKIEEPIAARVTQVMENEMQGSNLVSLNTDSDVLTVTYVEKSWTEIRDADSNTLMQGLIESGVVRNLSGKAPFEVFLGNSPGVVIEVNGQYFDHSQFKRSNRTARFQVSNSSFN